MTFRLYAVCLALLTSIAGSALAEPAPFDLVGPTLEVTVTHAGVTLPIGETPNLTAGDQLWIKADLPSAQSAHYLLVAAFLRGATDPPPESWFHRSEIWKDTTAKGLSVTVPHDAQQVLIFLAPQTGGDFKTLVDAVRGRPGAFVRASQDLNQATLDRSRLDAFLAAIRGVGPDDPDVLKTASPLLARSLAIKVDADCLQKPLALQVSCLTQGQDSLVLNDGHSTTIAQALSSGDSANLISALSSTPQAGFGYYSPYVGAVMDIVRIMDSLHTARYQYIPALATERDDRFSLLLNAPPSFQDPKSVLVAALPAVEPPQPPPLRAVDPNAVYCAEKPDLLLPVEGGPLAFSTAYVHDMVLRLKGKNGQSFDAPVKAAADKGGFIVDTSGVAAAALDDALDGSLHGDWGFTAFDGPQFHLRNARPEHWDLSADDQQSLIIGRDDTVQFQSPQAACVEAVKVRQGTGEPQAVDWKWVQPDALAVTLPLQHAQPGPVTLLVTQYGRKEADAVPLQVFAQAGRLDGFDLYVGDPSGVLKGARLDEVTALNVGNLVFSPGQLTTVHGADELSMVASDAQAVGQLRAGETVTAKVGLRDGRTVNLRITVQPPRPSVALISKTIQPDALNAAGRIQLGDKDELPFGSVLTFSIRAQTPARFTGRESVEVASADRAAIATLTFTGGLVLEDAGVAVATLDTAKAFNTSTFGALRFRIVEDGVAGDWQRLVALVRLPVLHHVRCPTAPALSCELTGSDLFLIDSVAGDPRFDRAVKVPEGFTGPALQIPHLSGPRLYLKLRDDPSAIATVTLPP